MMEADREDSDDSELEQGPDNKIFQKNVLKVDAFFKEDGEDTG